MQQLAHFSSQPAFCCHANIAQYYQFFLDKHGYVDGVTPPVDRFYETPSERAKFAAV